MTAAVLLVFAVAALVLLVLLLREVGDDGCADVGVPEFRPGTAAWHMRQLEIRVREVERAFGRALLPAAQRATRAFKEFAARMHA